MSIPRIASALALAVLAGACAHPIVPAHSLDATITVDGVETHAVLAFPDHDAAAHHDDYVAWRDKDSACKCGHDTPSFATISGDPRITDRIIYASISTNEDGTHITYELEIIAPAEVKIDSLDSEADCTIRQEDLGSTRACSGDTKPVTIALRSR